jgi:amidase
LTIGTETSGSIISPTVANAALNLQSTAGPDPDSVAEYTAIFGPNIDAVLPPAPATVPNYLSALDLNFVRGKRIGYNGTLTEGTPLKIAYDALVAAGAIMVSRPTIAVGSMPALPAPSRG